MTSDLASATRQLYPKLKVCLVAYVSLILPEFERHLYELGSSRAVAGCCGINVINITSVIEQYQ
jgi:hypothetical protein